MFKPVSPSYEFRASVSGTVRVAEVAVGNQRRHRTYYTREELLKEINARQIRCFLIEWLNGSVIEYQVKRGEFKWSA